MSTGELRRLDRRTRLTVVVGIVILLAAVALPTLAANPGVAPGRDNAGAEPVQAEKSTPPGLEKARKAKVPKEPITIRGSVTAATDADGNAVYRMTSGGTTYDLEAGPAWFHGDNHPLKAFAGKTVTIVGEIAEGSTEVSVDTVDGNALREGGKPPWAGGWKRVGEAHPGWSQEKADRMQAKADRMKARFGDCFPPGQCKQDDAPTE
jgi:hypothetical protein